MHAILTDRLAFLKAERTQHAYDHSYHLNDSAGHYLTSDNEYRFHDLDHFRYYEVLTGHIEEVQYLIAATKRQQ